MCVKPKEYHWFCAFYRCNQPLVFLFFVDGVLFRTMAPSSSMFFLNFSVRVFEVSRGPFRNLFLVGRPTARCPEVGLDFWFLRCPEVELEIWFLMSRSWIGHLAARCPEVGLEFCVFTIFVFPSKFERLYEEVEGSLTIRVGYRGGGGNGPAGKFVR